MIEKQEIDIVIYDYEPYIARTILSALNMDGFYNVRATSSLDNLLLLFNKVSFKTPQIVILDLVALDDFAGVKTTGLYIIEKLKKDYKDVIIICINIETGLNNDMPVQALIRGCDSWIDKKESNYIENITDAVNHWSQYVVERYKLTIMYNSILNFNNNNKLEATLQETT